MQKENRADNIDELLQICQEHHLKITPQRVAIYKELIRLNTHPTADAIFNIVKKDYPNISFDTVNRTLLTFAEIGIVDIVEIFGGAKRFDPIVTTHHHLHCIRCGKVFDFHCRAYDKIKIPAEVKEQFQVMSKRVVLKGVCKTCRNYYHHSLSKPTERRKNEQNNRKSTSGFCRRVPGTKQVYVFC